MEKFKNNTKGITLVVLVITIIILLILAGITISSLTNTGIFEKAKESKNLTEEKTAKENEILTNYLEQITAITEGQITENIPDGTIVIPINDVATWIKTGGLSNQYSYTTIEQVISDNTCTESLMNNKNAMKYLARSTEFANAICASETAMTYLGKSTYLTDTVLNNDLWKQKIKASQYWEKVYSSKTVTVYGASNEIITIDGYGGSFTTGSDGSCSHVVPIETITLKGSVSGKSFTRTVTNNTTQVYVMPEKALYWYGNQCKNITGGWTNSGFTILNSSVSSGKFNTNELNLKCTNYEFVGNGTVNTISFAGSSLFKTISNTTNDCWAAASKTKTNMHPETKEVGLYSVAGEASIDVKNINDSMYIFMGNGSQNNTLTPIFYAVWLE